MTLYEILEESSLEWREHPQKADEIKICCPFCVERNENPDERFRLGVNTTTGQANCFNCGWHSDNLVWTARELARVGEVDLRASRVTVQPEALKPAKAKPVPAVAYLDDLPSGFEHFNWRSSFERPARDYLMNRGITQDQIERWEIGWAMTGEYAYRVIIPVVMDGKLAGVVGRDYTGTSDLRYKNSESLRGVFGAKKFDGATITEGAMDALRVEPLAAKLSEDSVALFGSNLSDDQIRFLKARYKRMLYMPDHDAPGCKGARVNCEVLADAGIEMRVAIPARLDGTDPGNQSDDFLLHRWRTAVKWSKNVERTLKYREAFG